jgi:hypothetical protein
VNKYSSAHVSLGPDSPNVYSRAAEISVMVDVFKLALRRLRLEGCEFKAILDNLMRPLLGVKKKEGREEGREREGEMERGKKEKGKVEREGKRRGMLGRKQK